MTDANEKVQHLEHLVIETIASNLPDNMDVVFEALQRTFVFFMSSTCPVCRRNIARKLKRDIPHMLADANDFAAFETAQDGHEHIH